MLKSSCPLLERVFVAHQLRAWRGGVGGDGVPQRKAVGRKQTGAFETTHAGEIGDGGVPVYGWWCACVCMDGGVPVYGWWCACVWMVVCVCMGGGVSVCVCMVVYLCVNSGACT